MIAALNPLRAGRIISAMTLLTFIGQFLALIRESAIAAKFGAGNLTDAFLLAIMLPNALLLLIQNGFLMAFIPTIGSVIVTEERLKALRTIHNLITAALIGLLAISIFVWLVADSIVRFLAPSLSSSDHHLVVQMLQPLTLISILGGSASLLTGIANVHRRFVAPALFGLVLNGTMILCIIFLGNVLSIHVLVLSTVLAHAIQTFLLIWALSPVYRYRPVLDFSDPKLCGLFKLALPAIGTLMLQQIVVFADRAIAVKYGVGSVAALNFASRLVLVLYPLLIGALSSLVLPELSRSIANGEWDHARKLANSICRYAVFLIAPLAAILLMMRGPIIQLAFERGEFTAHDSYLTQGPMACYTLTLLSLSLRELIVRFFYAAHDTITPLLTGTIRTIINLSLNIVLSQWIGISGIALANALAITSDVFILRIIVRRKWGLPSSTAFGLKVAVALIALITVISIFTKTGATLGFGSGWILAACQISISAAIGISVYWGIALLLKVPESKQILSIMRKQFKLTHS